jgi:GR25 family glycosyltransferase involved in LPS biosynthesis
MTMIAAASGLKLSFVHGINRKGLDKQTLPVAYGTSEIILEPGHLACYRGHANIWRKIIEDGVETALILEDDIDWDLNIREIIPRIRRALPKITGEPNSFSNTPGCLILNNVNST